MRGNAGHGRQDRQGRAGDASTPSVDTIGFMGNHAVLIPAGLEFEIVHLRQSFSKSHPRLMVDRSRA